MDLTTEQIIKLCPMKIELVSDRRICKLSDLKLGNLFFENKQFPSKSGYFISYIDDRLILASLGFGGKFVLGYPNHFTTIEDIEVRIPHIFRQIQGNNKGALCYLPYYEAWKMYCNTIEDFTKSNDKRMFLHSYVNQNITVG